MRFIALAALLAVSLPAQAQLYKCVDAKGRTHYTDKPLADCKGATPAEIKPPPPVPGREARADPGKARKAAEKKKRENQAKKPGAQERKQLAALCRGWKEEEAWLLRSREEHRDNRLGQVRQALRQCH